MKTSVMRHFIFWLFTVSALLLSLSIHAADNRVALVIGNKDYVKAPLDNPVNDAQDIKAALEQVGFRVIYRENARLADMNDAVREFIRSLQKNSVGVVYYSGHGAQADGTNYLIPVDMDITSKSELKSRGYDVGIILDEMQQAENMINIVILDACRNNPFRGFKGGTEGLASMSGPRGTLIAFATAPGSVASDNIEATGRNGLYTAYLKQYLVQPGLTMEEMFKKVREAVVKKNRDQVPWENSSITGNFCFAGCTAQPIVVEQPEKTSKQTSEIKVPAAVSVEPIAPQKPSTNTSATKPAGQEKTLSARCSLLLGKFQVGTITAEEYRKECQALK